MEHINKALQETSIQASVNLEGIDPFESEAKKKCEEQAVRWIKSNRENIEAILKKQGVPRKYLQAKSGDVENSLLQKAELSILSGKGVYFHGDPGTGKTFFAVALMRDIILSLRPELIPVSTYKVFEIEYPKMPLFFNTADILVEIRESFRNDSKGLSESEIIDKYSTVSTLILDDLGVEKSTEWSLQTLYTIINRRDGEEMPMIITSNLSLGQIADRMGDRISSRIAGMCRVIELKGKDRRLAR